MPRTRKKSTSPKRPPPKPRPEPTGVDADAISPLGQISTFISKYNLQIYDIFIRNQVAWYQNHQTWDPVDESHSTTSTRKSTIRRVLADIYNNMAFPRHLIDLQKAVRSMGYNLKPVRIMHYLNQMGVFLSTISRCLNPTRTDTCIARTTRAIAMKQELQELKAKLIPNDKTRKTFWYYYDQSPFQQLDKKRDKVLGPKGLKIYDPSKDTLKPPSLTLHMIVDQYGKMVDQLWAEGGQGEKEIRSFLTNTRGRVPKNIRPILYCDNLATHKKLSLEKKFCWDVRLLPVSSSDANIIEHQFSSLKNYLYQQLAGQEHTKKTDELKRWCTTNTYNWWNGYHESDALLNNSMKFLDLLIEAKGDLQQVALLKSGYKSIDALHIDPLHVDVE